MLQGVSVKKGEVRLECDVVVCGSGAGGGSGCRAVGTGWLAGHCAGEIPVVPCWRHEPDGEREHGGNVRLLFLVS